MPLLAHDVLCGRYELGPLLGRGGTAEVRIGFDRRLGRDVAVKMFDSTCWTRPEQRARFLAEARAAAAVNHPNVVAVHDAGVDHERPFLVMERLPGRTFAHDLHRGPLPARRVLRIVRQALAGLAAAHDRDVLHHDIKPGNMLFSADGAVKVGDFGVATFGGGGGGGRTASALVLGTPAYMAPERVAGRASSVRSDLWSVGVVCYEALAGERPFRGRTPLELARTVHAGRVRPLHDLRPDLPDALCDAVMRALAPMPASRFGSAREMAAMLTAAASPVLTPARPRPATARVAARRVPRRGRGVAVACGVVAAAAIFVGARTSASEPRPTAPAPAVGTPGALPAEMQDALDALDDAIRR